MTQHECEQIARETYRPFLGVWHAHGFNLEVTPNGNVYATYRMYEWCSAHRQYACLPQTRH